MIALLDIGNSRIKWASWDKQGLCAGQPLPTQASFEASLEEAWGGRGPCRVVVSNVAGVTMEERLHRWLVARFGVEPEFVRSRAQGYGVLSGYRQPERLGCDRWVALVALRHNFPGAACVLDVGTAATFDLLDSDGHHRGGAIAPGLQLMAGALTANTVAINAIEARSTGGWLGEDTSAAIHCGTLNALAGLAERLRDRACRELGEPVRGIVTGGDAAAVAACLNKDWLVVPDLLLQGLAVIAQEAQ